MRGDIDFSINMHHATTLGEKKDTVEVYLKALTEFALLLLRVNDKPS